MTRAAQLCTRAALADVARGRGRLDLSLVLAREAVQLAERIGRESLAHHPRLQFCQTATALDLFDEARAVAEQGRRIVSAVGGAWSHPQYHLVLAELHLAAGRLDDARSTAEAGLATSADRRAPQAVMPLLALLARLALRCDAPEAAAELLHEADRVAARQGEHGHELAFARAEYWAALDRAVDGFEAVEAMYPSLVAWPLPLVQEPLVAMRLLDLARRARRPEEAWSVVTAVKAVAARNPRSRSLNGVAAHVDALHRGDTAALRQAVHLLRGTPRPLVLAAALEDLALAERDDGRHEPAARLLAEAEELHRHAASARDRERVAALRQGLTGSPAGGTADSTAWDSLTPSELRVVRFVAQGLTNREVAQRLSVSRHTVDSHLRHTFTKLGVGNRVELTRIFLAREGAISNGAVT
jgi:ATP/maltotriose-dependent transcriptional regulator MalT